MEALKAALEALIDERLAEHGLLQAKAGKGGKKGGKPATADDDEITLETLKEKVTELVNKKGKPAVKELLKKAKIEKLTELPEKHYAAFNKKLDEELAEESEDDLFGD